jgi:mannose-6-phosphate isomerase-like protein (cupin superfamily)
LNSDDWLVRKKGAAFMPWNERFCIINNLSMVDEVYTFDDDDGSAKHFIQQARAHYPNAELIFANGGDRTKDNIPEMDVVDANLSFVFGVGGENKMNSSSWILQEWKAPKTQRPWGYYRVLHQDGTEIKVKELTVNPGCSLSMQRHRYRHEHWFVTEGTATINTLDTDGNTVMNNFVMKNMQTYIGKEEWHQLVNKNHTPLKVIEIQFGEQCTEEDIERK